MCFLVLSLAGLPRPILNRFWTSVSYVFLGPFAGRPASSDSVDVIPFS
jgi:hypothetical protein